MSHLKFSKTHVTHPVGGSSTWPRQMCSPNGNNYASKVPTSLALRRRDRRHSIRGSYKTCSSKKVKQKKKQKQKEKEKKKTIEAWSDKISFGNPAAIILFSLWSFKANTFFWVCQLIKSFNVNITKKKCQEPSGESVFRMQCIQTVNTDTQCRSITTYFTEK